MNALTFNRFEIFNPVYSKNLVVFEEVITF